MKEQERYDESKSFCTIVLENIIAWPAIHILAICVGIVVGLLSYLHFQPIIGFFIGIVTMITLLLFLSFVLYICKIPIDTFTNSVCFKDDECIFYLLYIPCITIMWDCIYLYKNEYTKYRFLIIFPFIVMMLLLFVFMYRIGAGKTHVATEYQGDKKRKVWTILFFIIIQLQIFIMGVMCVQLRGTGLVWSDDSKNELIRLLNIIYFVIMTYTSVGYGDLLPFGTCMKVLVAIISISAFLSGVLLIGALCNMFHEESGKTIQPDEKFPYVDLYKIIKKHFSKLKKNKVQAKAHICKDGKYIFRDKLNCKYNGFLHALLLFSVLVFVFSVVTGILVIFQSSLANLCSYKIQGNSSLNIVSIIYYVIITFTSVGYGDITPATGLAKGLACVISLVGYLSSAYLLSTIYETTRKDQK